MANDLMRNPVGGCINRERPVQFQFNGKSYKGYEGDTLASALIANGVRLVGRSFKYHRPRGMMSAGIEETNALVQLLSPRDEPNLRATGVPLTDGLRARSINCWPSVEWDVGALNSLLSPVFPAGFYYKTFMWRPWKFYAKTIRKFAGLGTNPVDHQPGHYEKRFHNCDVLVVGAGVAGLSAAQLVASSGVRVVLVDDQTRTGGDLLNSPASINDDDAMQWVDQVTEELDHNPMVLRLQDALAAGYYDHNLITVVEKSPQQSWVTERFWKIRARRVILATGSIERPLIFSNNDRPGVMLASSASTFLHRYGVRAGNRAVVVTNNNSAYAAAIALHQGGIEVAAIVDLRTTVKKELSILADHHGIKLITGHTVIDVHGKKSVTAALIAPIDQRQVSRFINCDLVCVSGGWNPGVHLHSQSGAKPVYDDTDACFKPGQSVQQEISAGAAAGHVQLSQCLASGIDAAIASLAAMGINIDYSELPRTADTPCLDPLVDWGIETAKSGGKAFVDFQNDVSTADIALALRENFVSVEHIKRYTTAGMATDQGKSGNTNVIGHIASQLCRQPGDVGTTTYRPPYAPISFGAIGGMDTEELIIPIRRTALTQWHIDQGAAMNEAGANYRRPFWYPKPAESEHDAIMRAARAVREGVGIYDGSPLGKFELFGDDVEQLLDLVYTNRFDKLEPGQGKFGLMLQEDGRLLDDGVTFRLDQKRYLMSTGTGTASVIYAHLERLLQTEFSHWKVFITPVTNQWANICVCGPKAKTVLQKAGTDIDLNNEFFPFLAIRQGKVAGVPARVARVSYTGELSYEINVARRHSQAIWDALFEAGAPYNITSVGSETSAVLRIEKGFISAGSEGDNITNPFDAGIGWIVDLGKNDFIGKRALIRDQQQSFTRHQVVGLLPIESAFVPAEGSALLSGDPGAQTFQGHVTAACFSPNLDRSICLALLKNGQSRMGETVTISGLERTVEAEVTRPIFIDPKGVRMKS